jgi:ADP-ribosylglycohydrolase
VNHSGDSDSTGSIAGNLLGAVHGLDALPTDLLEQLEARVLIERTAEQLTKY